MAGLVRWRYPMRSDYEADASNSPGGCTTVLVFVGGLMTAAYTAGAVWGFPHFITAAAKWLFGC